MKPQRGCCNVRIGMLGPNWLLDRAHVALIAARHWSLPIRFGASKCVCGGTLRWTSSLAGSSQVAQSIKQCRLSCQSGQHVSDRESKRSTLLRPGCNLLWGPCQCTVVRRKPKSTKAQCNHTMIPSIFPVFCLTVPPSTVPIIFSGEFSL